MALDANLLHSILFDIQQKIEWEYFQKMSNYSFKLNRCFTINTVIKIHF